MSRPFGDVAVCSLQFAFEGHFAGRFRDHIICPLLLFSSTILPGCNFNLISVFLSAPTPIKGPIVMPHIYRAFLCLHLSGTNRTFCSLLAGLLGSLFASLFSLFFSCWSLSPAHLLRFGLSLLPLLLRLRWLSPHCLLWWMWLSLSLRLRWLSPRYLLRWLLLSLCLRLRWLSPQCLLCHELPSICVVDTLAFAALLSIVITVVRMFAVATRVALHHQRIGGRTRIVGRNQFFATMQRGHVCALDLPAGLALRKLGRRGMRVHCNRFS